MMLLAVLALFLADDSSAICRTRTAYETGVAAVIARSDTDHDGPLSRTEWKSMGDAALASMRDQAEPDMIERVRQEIMQDFRAEDADGDGYLTKAEMLKIRLAAFPCLDADRNGALSDEEVAAGTDKCRPTAPAS